MANLRQTAGRLSSGLIQIWITWKPEITELGFHKMIRVLISVALFLLGLFLMETFPIIGMVVSMLGGVLLEAKPGPGLGYPKTTHTPEEIPVAAPTPAATMLMLSPPAIRSETHQRRKIIRLQGAKG